MANTSELEALLLSLPGHGRNPITITSVVRDQIYTSIFHVYHASKERESTHPCTAFVKEENIIVITYGFFIDVPAQREKEARQILESNSEGFECGFMLERRRDDPELHLLAYRQVPVPPIPRRKKEKEAIYDRIVTEVINLQFDMYTMSHRIEEYFGIVHTGDSTKRH